MNFVKIGDLTLAKGYMECLEIIKTAEDRTSKINESKVCGEFEFMDGSKIIAIPSNKRNDRNKLVKSNTKYYIEKFLNDSGVLIFANKEVLKEKLDKFMDESFELY